MVFFLDSPKIAFLGLKYFNMVAGTVKTRVMFVQFVHKERLHSGLGHCEDQPILCVT